jgi:hypothetical protein
MNEHPSPGNPAPPIPPDSRRDQYAELASEADAKLDDQLARIRRDQDSGKITPAEAATERVLVMEQHLARLALLRAEYLPGSR